MVVLESADHSTSREFQFLRKPVLAGILVPLVAVNHRCGSLPIPFRKRTTMTIHCYQMGKDARAGSQRRNLPLILSMDLMDLFMSCCCPTSVLMFAHDVLFVQLSVLVLLT